MIKTMRKVKEIDLRFFEDDQTGEYGLAHKETIETT